MVSCAVLSCKNASGKISKDKDGITFHRFPRNIERRKQWELAVNREVEWSSTSFSAVCSEHFDTGDFYLTESGLRRLSMAAVPSINISVIEAPEPTISHKFNINMKVTDTEEVIHLKEKIKRLEIISDNRKRKMNLLWQEKRRLCKKLEQMRCLIKHLVKTKKERDR